MVIPRLLLKLAWALTLSGCSSENETMAALDGVMKPYETCRALLAADNAEGMTECAQAIEAASAKGQESLPETAKPHLGAIEAAAAELALVAPEKLSALRVAFSEVSKAVVALLGDMPEAAEKYYIFKCPMTMSYKRWVQPDPELANPYMGTAMLTCGYEVE